MTPVELVCAILAERDIARMGVPPCDHTERLRRDLAIGWQPTAERIVRELCDCEPTEARQTAKGRQEQYPAARELEASGEAKNRPSGHIRNVA